MAKARRRKRSLVRMQRLVNVLILSEGRCDGQSSFEKEFLAPKSRGRSMSRMDGAMAKVRRRKRSLVRTRKRLVAVLFLPSRKDGAMAKVRRRKRSLVHTRKRLVAVLFLFSIF